MWFIFPQVVGLGNSFMARKYAITSAAEAKAYLAHPLLGPRLRECVEALLAVDYRSVEQIMGDPDFLKLRSSMTLFTVVSPPESRFSDLLKKFYGGKRDESTISFLSGDET